MFFFFVLNILIIMNKIILYIISFIMMVIGLTFIILYINLLSFGYNIFEYINFIFTNYECYFFYIGFIIFIILVLKG